MVPRQLNSRGRRNREIGVAVGHLEGKSGEGEEDVLKVRLHTGYRRDKIVTLKILLTSPNFQAKLFQPVEESGDTQAVEKCWHAYRKGASKCLKDKASPLLSQKDLFQTDLESLIICQCSLLRPFCSATSPADFRLDLALLQ